MRLSLCVTQPEYGLTDDVKLMTFCQNLHSLQRPVISAVDHTSSVWAYIVLYY